MRAYQPSGVISGGGFLLLLLLAVLAGVVVGAVLWAVDNYVHFYLVIAFPILAGAIAGGLLIRAVKSSKIRNPLMAGLAGIIAGLIMYGVYHYASYYISFRNDFIRPTYIENNPGSTPTDTQLDQFMNDGLMRAVQDTGFIGYIKYTAKIGFTITRTGSTSSETPIELKDNVAYGYWVLEILIAAGVAAVLAANAAREPFDETANTWYGGPTVFAIASTKSRKQLMRALKDGNFQEAGGLMTKEQIKYPRIEIWTRRSPESTDQDVLLIVNHMQRSNRPNRIKQGMVSRADLDALNRAIGQVSPANPVVSKT
jgi:hypothetical protein